MSSLEQLVEPAGHCDFATSPSKGRPRVALVYGFWGQNIGNAFFNIGGRWILEQLFPGEVAEIQDQPAYRSFHRKHSGNPKNDFELLKYLDVDYIVLQGPMFTTSFRIIWEETFRALRARGTKIILLSAAFFRYTEEEINSVRGFLKEYPPALISTRDGDSFEHIKDLSEYTYSGIDSAFFVPRAYQPVHFRIDPYICINFDQYPEPELHTAATEAALGTGWDKTFEGLGQWWGARQPSLQMKFSHAGQWQCYLGALLDFRKLPNEIAGRTMIRTDHRVNPHVTWKVYQRPNTVATDEPYTYFSLYAGTDLTLSDRVHACVATLAYGKPAMLYHPTPRARLFARVGLDEIRNRPCTLSPEYLDQERDSELEFLKQTIAKLD